MARRRHSNRRHRRGSFGFLYKVLSMLVICGAIIAALTLFFRVGTIVVTGQERYTEAEVIAATGVEQEDWQNAFAKGRSVVPDVKHILTLRING